MNPDQVLNEEKPLILIVDDLPRNVQVLHQILNTGEYSFAIASDGGEALRLVKKKLPDLILLDIMMGDIDGFEVCKRLKEKPATAQIPIIFLTAKTDVEDKVRGFKLGAIDYITKPFENAEVVARVHTHIQLKKSIDMIRDYNHQLSEIVEDIKKSYRELRDSQHERINEEKRDAVKAMVVTANHEINQPLTMIQGYVDLLKQSMNSQSQSVAQKKYLDGIERAFERIMIILERFRESAAIRFTNYLPNIKMVLFDDKKKNNEPNN
ncbi:MAG: response regulator [Candidatus Aminicenantes bacterium]|nr:response regulator [Candidatus Aminicenantes bacterium]